MPRRSGPTLPATNEVLDVAVIGAGQAGLAVSYHLTQSQATHLVLERGRIGESWRSQRWDSFYLNTPNWANGLPGMECHSEVPDQFSSRDDLVSFFERYAASFEAPIREHARITRLERLSTGEYGLRVNRDTLSARAVVIASGSMSRPRVPTIAEKLPPDVASLSAGSYRNPESLSDGAVLVVGTGQSGCQIAEDLLEAGRTVYVSASRVGRIPRVYRGKDILAWWRDMGYLEVDVDDLEDPAVRFAAQPQVSGTRGGHTVSLQSLARDGATLMGHLADIEGDRLKFHRDLAESVTFADEKSQAFKAAIDGFIQSQGLSAPDPVPDPGEAESGEFRVSGVVDDFDLRSRGVSTVIWCTGFDADWSWVDLDVFDDKGLPSHRRGIARVPGVYFIGFPWLSKRKSGIVYGVSEDAARIVAHIQANVLAAADPDTR